MRPEPSSNGGVAQTGGLGLADLARNAEPERHPPVVVVDQFEELFRFQEAGGRARVHGQSGIRS